MLGPPTGGSEVIQAMTSRPGLATVYREMPGTTRNEPAAGPAGILDHLPAVTFELGVVAGSRSVNPAFSALIPRPNQSNGKLSVSRTVVTGMRDMVVLPRAHPLLIRAPDAIDYTVRFIETGSFAERRRASNPNGSLAYRAIPAPT